MEQTDEFGSTARHADNMSDFFRVNLLLMTAFISAVVLTTDQIDSSSIAVFLDPIVLFGLIGWFISTLVLGVGIVLSNPTSTSNPDTYISAEQANNLFRTAVVVILLSISGFFVGLLNVVLTENVEWWTVRTTFVISIGLLMLIFGMWFYIRPSISASYTLYKMGKRTLAPVLERMMGSRPEMAHKKNRLATSI